MKTLVKIIILLLLVCSCKIMPTALSDFTENPFLEPIDLASQNETYEKSSELITGPDSNGKINFSAITDIHLDRTNDGPIKYFHEEYKVFLKQKNYPFILCMGDLSDQGIMNENVESFIHSVTDLTTNKRFVYCIGNHERHEFDSYKWNKDYTSSYIGSKDVLTTAGAYTFGKESGRPILTIYKLDTTTRTIGKKQFQYLEEALSVDRSKYKIIITHDTIATGTTADISLVLFGLNPSERNHLYRIMSEYKVGLVISGHYHKGNLEYHQNEYMGELNLAAYHQRHTKPFEYESMGYWYDVELDVESGVVTITSYLAETSKAEHQYIFKLPKAF